MKRSTPVSLLLRQIRRVLGPGSASAVIDRDLLDRFANQADENAFAALMERYAAMVFNICLRVLDDEQEAEDAFQATFLVLARKAGSVSWQQSVGNWLFGVAYRVAMKAKGQRIRRQVREQVSMSHRNEEAEPVPDASWEEIRGLLDEEIHRLPEKYRVPIVFHYLLGKTKEETARELGWEEGTVSGRLARARELLRTRLERRGLVLTSGLLAIFLSEQVQAGLLPPQLTTATLRAATLVVAGETAWGVSKSVTLLTKGALHSMFMTKLKVAAVLLLAVGIIAGGAGLALRQAAGAKPDGPAGQPLAGNDEKQPQTDRRENQQAAPDSPVKQAVPIEAWNDLATRDDVKVARAITLMAKAPPEETVAFLMERLQPVSADATKVARLIEDLEAEQFARREQATESLQYLGKYAAPFLRKAMEGNPGLETRQRLEKLLNEAEPGSTIPGRAVPGQGVPQAASGMRPGMPGLNNAPTPAEPTGPSVLWLRAVRAITVLEAINSPAAREVIKNVAGGEAEALPTREAKTALERLAKQMP